MSGSIDIRKTFLNYIILKLVLIRIGRDHKGDKALAQNIVVFPELELETIHTQISTNQERPQG